MPLNPGDVPQDLVDDAVDAWHEASPALLDDELRQVLAAVLPGAFKLLAKRIQLSADVTVGLLCPACHGRPSAYRFPQYKCGCGHAWEVSRSGLGSAAAVETVRLFRQVAETGELPAVPDKVARGER